LLGQLSVRCPHKPAALLVTGGSERRGAHWRRVSTAAGGLVKGVSGEDIEPKVVGVISMVRELRGDGGQLTVVAVVLGNGGSGSSMWTHLVADEVNSGQWLRAGL
jgi:hypothetical protein